MRGTVTSLVLKQFYLTWVTQPVGGFGAAAAAGASVT